MKSGLILLMTAFCLHLSANASTFSITPSTISEQFQGELVFTIGAIQPGASVRVDKHIDFNTNGVVDPGDFVVQSFPLTDGQRPAIGGVANLNVPGDEDRVVNGSIRAQLYLPTSSPLDSMAGQFIYRVVDPTNGFAAVQRPFTVARGSTKQGLLGTMRYKNGQPIRNALVFFTDDLRSWFTTTDANGRYRVHTAPGSYSFHPLTADTPIQPSGSVYAAEGAFRTVDLELSRLQDALTTNSRRITGKVIDAATGKGVPGVRLLFWSSFRSGTFTDNTGAFSIAATAEPSGLEMDSLGLPLLGYLTTQGYHRIDAGPHNVTTNFTVRPASTLIYGKVLNHWDDSLSGIAVAGKVSEQWYSGRTRATTFYLAGLPGSNSFNADFTELSARGLRQVPSLPVTLSTNQAVRRDIRVKPFDTFVRGRITDIAGNPVRGIEMMLVSMTSAQYGVSRSKTIADGFYELGAVQGNAELKFNSEQLAALNLVGPDLYGHWFSITNGVNQTNNFTLGRVTSYITGRVQSSTGAGLTNLEVRVSTTLNGRTYNSSRFTDNQGGFSIPVFPGTWEIDVSEYYLSQRGFDRVPSQSILIPSGNHFVSFIANPFSASIRGRLVTQTGEPVAGANVTGFNQSSITGTRTYYAGTDTNGNFVLRGNPGDWTLWLDPPYAPQFTYFRISTNLTVVAQTPLNLGDITMHKATTSIRGTLRDTRGRPVPGIEVRFAKLTTPPVATILSSGPSTDSTGAFSIPVYEGSWLLSFDCRELTGAGFGCIDPLEIEVGSAGVRTNLAVAVLTNEVRGRVVDLAGRGVGNITVEGRAGSDFSPSVAVDTDANGYFSSKIRPGRWSFSLDYFDAYLRNLVTGTVTFTLPTNQLSTNIIIFAPQQVSTITGSIRNADGSVRSNMWLTASCTNNGTIFIRTALSDVSGSFRFSVFPGTWTVRVDCWSPTDYQCPPPKTLAVGTGTAPVNFVIYPPEPLRITTESLPPGTNGTFYSVTLNTTGGVAVWLPTWNVVSNSLPSSLSISRGGNIAGFLYEDGQFPVTVSVSDGRTTALKTFTLTVKPCNVGLNRTFISAPATGTNESLVANNWWCSSGVKNTNTWIFAQRSGNSVPCYIYPNPSSVPRIGTFMVGDQKVTVYQAGRLAPDTLAGKRLVFTQYTDRRSATVLKTNCFIFDIANSTKVSGRWSSYFHDWTVATLSMVLNGGAQTGFALDFASRSTGTAAWPSAGGHYSFTLMDATPDFDHDGRTDLVWQNSDSGEVYAWHTDGEKLLAATKLLVAREPDWRAVGAADFESDGYTDLLWQDDSSGTIAMTLRQAGPNRTVYLPNDDDGPVIAGWNAVTTTDLNNDRELDIVWQHNIGALAAWLMNGTNVVRRVSLASPLPTRQWKLIGANDFNGDGQSDLLFSNSNNQVATGFYLATKPMGSRVINLPANAAGSQVISVNDFDEDGDADLLLQSTNRVLSILYMSQATPSNLVPLRNGTPLELNLRLVAPK